MLYSKKVFAILAIISGSVLFMLIYSGKQQSYLKEGSGPKASPTFLTVKEMTFYEEGAYESDQEADQEKGQDIIVSSRFGSDSGFQDIEGEFEQEFEDEDEDDSIATARYNPFALLGAYPDPDPYIREPAYDKPHYGLINDDGYCDRVDKYNLEHPENMFKRMNFFTDFPARSVMKMLVMSKLGVQYMNHVQRGMPKRWSEFRRYPIEPRITAFHISGDQFYKYHKIGKHYLCATQMFSHIPNHTDLIQKDHFPQRVQDYLLKYHDRPQCFDKNTLYPATYRLFVQSECQEFFEIMNSQQYNESLKTEPIQYIVKIGHGAHMAQGVFLLDSNQTEKLNSEFNFGKNCGEVDNYLIVQKYITNPMLLNNNNKFHMRVYVLIASTNPLIVYYHDGYLRASIFPFDKFSEDRATHLTNLLTGGKVAQTLNQSEENITTGKTAKQLEDFYLWSFEELENYLLESGKTNDPDWLNNHLRPALQKAFVHVIRMTSSPFWKQSNVYELLGCDFMLDDNMNVWFLEANPNPLLDGVQQNMITKMLKDMFEIQYAYYRSRMKRVLKVIQNMKAENGDGTVNDLDKWKVMYRETVKNRLEPEYRIRGTNSFQIIMDESLPGARAYFGHIPQECLD